ncbi:MAG: hypothetical protein HQK71_13105 [Desulfamplus sp.]|nr:hypothetical protein [Desulfamplus sp.]
MIEKQLKIAQNLGVRRTIKIVDTTLRDGLQAPGVLFDSDEKRSIAVALSEAGVDELEVGIPAMGIESQNGINHLCNLNLSCNLISWCRAVSGDILAAAKTKTDAISISFPTSEILLKTFGKDQSWLFDFLPSMVELASKYFDKIYVGAQDATRTDFELLSRFAKIANKLGVARIRIADTVGVATPFSTFNLIKKIKDLTPNLEVEFHAHNDLGMATANAFCAAEAGADALSVTVNGLGERAGNAPLEEVSVALFGVGNFDGKIKLHHLKNLSTMVSKASNRPIHKAKPIVGSDVFKHESGIHCMAMLKNSDSYQPFDPLIIGADEAQFGIGGQSGCAIIRHLLAMAGITVSQKDALILLDHVRCAAIKSKSSISVEELIALYFQTFQKVA